MASDAAQDADTVAVLGDLHAAVERFRWEHDALPDAVKMRLIDAETALLRAVEEARTDG